MWIGSKLKLNSLGTFSSIFKDKIAGFAVFSQISLSDGLVILEPFIMFMDKQEGQAQCAETLSEESSTKNIV